MYKIIPIFPLQLVVYPYEQLNLHIFEPRYKQLIQDCESGKLTFGIPAFIEQKIMSIGTEVKLEKVHQTYADGRMDITAEAINIFRIHEVMEKVEGKLYSGAQIEPYSFNIEHDGSLNAEILLKIRLLFESLQIQKELPAPDQVLSFNIAHLIGLSLDQEYELLQIKDEFSRQHFILDHLNQIIPLAQRMESIRKKAQMNGHFREYDQLEF